MSSKENTDLKDIEKIYDNKEEKVEDNKIEEKVKDNKIEEKEVTGKFNSKTAENTTKTLNKVNFSRSRELSDKYAERIVDSAERYGKTITIDKIKEKLGADLFRNLKQTSLKFFDCVLFVKFFSIVILSSRC